MTSEEIREQLERSLRLSNGNASDLIVRAAELVDQWRAAAVGFDAVEPVFLFLEQHPDVDFGVPGPLGHYLEKYWKNGFEEKLVESVARRPTFTTLWLLTRLIHGTKDAARRAEYIDVMARAATNPAGDGEIRKLAAEWEREALL